MAAIDLRDKSHDEWLELRNSGIGGSDIACVLGENPYKQPLELWMEKTGKAPAADLSDNQRVEWGNRLEDIVAVAYADKTGYKVRRRNFMFTDAEYPFMLANIDRDVVGEKRVLECKTAGAFAMRDQWGDGNLYDADGKMLALDDKVPAHYLLQTLWYMSIVKRDAGDLAALIGGNDFRVYSFASDQEIAVLMRDAAKEFWALVQADTPPPLDYAHASSMALVKRLHPGCYGIKHLDASLTHWHECRREALSKVKAYQAAADGAKVHILEAMGSNAVGILDDGTVYSRALRKVKAREQGAYSFVSFDHRSGATAAKLIDANTED